MEKSKNVEILKTAYEYWDTNKEKAFENWMGLMDDDVKLRSLADGVAGMEFSRPCNCKDDVLRYFQEIAENWELISYKINEYVSEGNRVVAIGICHWRYIKTGKDVQTPKVDIVTFKGSKITEFFELYDTAKAIACTQK